MAEIKPLAPSARAALEAVTFADGSRWIDQPLADREWTMAVHRAAVAELAMQFVAVKVEGKTIAFDKAGFRAALGSEQWLESSNFKQNRLVKLELVKVDQKASKDAFK